LGGAIQTIKDTLAAQERGELDPPLTEVEKFEYTNNLAAMQAQKAAIDAEKAAQEKALQEA
jgi:hypothetical protein